MPKCSIVMATRNHGHLIGRALRSIFQQKVPFQFEVIVVDDGSDDDTPKVCEGFDVDYIRLENDEYRNPSLARNVGFRKAQGEVIIQQSDEVIHYSKDTIERLTNDLREGEFLIATVYNYDLKHDKIRNIYSGKINPRPFFFLGSLSRKDLYAVGGYDEDFKTPGFDDNWHADCLLKGLKLKVRYVDVIGYHQHHARLPGLIEEIYKPTRELYREKAKAAALNNIPYCSSGGPWDY